MGKYSAPRQGLRAHLEEILTEESRRSRQRLEHHLERFFCMENTAFQDKGATGPFGDITCQGEIQRPKTRTMGPFGDITETVKSPLKDKG